MPDWRDTIDEILQLPYAYCIHDKDKLSDKAEDRKTHVHIIVVWPAKSPVRYSQAFETFDSLSEEGKSCLSTCEPVRNIRWAWDYLIHDRDKARREGKYQYSADERISGNNFDVGAYETLDTHQKTVMEKELCDFILKSKITNMADFYERMSKEYDEEYFAVFRGCSALLERLTRGNYQRYGETKSNEVKLNIEPAEVALCDSQLRDADGQRLIVCEECGTLGHDSEFVRYGGEGSKNVGLCRNCAQEG